MLDTSCPVVHLSVQTLVAQAGSGTAHLSQVLPHPVAAVTTVAATNATAIAMRPTSER